MNPRVSIIIVNWNTKECLKDCLKSIYEKVRDISFEIIVVDNASTDGSQDLVKTEFPMISLIANNDNIGFGRACNQASKEARGIYLLILNPDTEIIAVDFKELFRLLEERGDIGAIVPLIYNEDGSLKYKVIRTVPKIRDIFNYYILHNRLRFKYSKPVSSTDSQEHEYPSGSCFLIKKHVFQRLGGFDEHYFLFFEDADLGVRMVQMGLKTISLPEFKIIHIGGKSTEKNIGLSNLSGHQSALFFFRKTKGVWGYIVIKIILMLSNFLWTSIYLIRYLVKLNIENSYKIYLKDNLNILRWHIKNFIL
jgi:hypothetical protein